MIEEANERKNLISEEVDLLSYRGSIAIMYMATPLVMSFSIIDYFYAREMFVDFFLIRLLIIPTVAIYYVLTKLQVRNSITHNFICLFLGSYNAYLVAHTGFEDSLYIFGLNLVAIGSLGFLPWQTLGLICNILVIYLPTVIVLFLKSDPYNWGNVFGNMSFCFSTIFLCTTSWYLLRKLRFKEFISRKSLQKMNEEKDIIIQKKTKESVFLQKLSKQFSEKTISLVLSGEINIDARIKRKITSIFIDIENSTSKANTLDYRDYLGLLDEFTNLSCDILIKHDITIGTFLGDGLMAFANAPLKIADQEEKALKACLEILEEREKFNLKIRDKWLSEFNIRIGISSDVAYCGFYPSGTKGVYTATGPVVNLSSRLCSLAPPNSVCLDDKFLEVFEQKKHHYEFTQLKGPYTIKGFENKKIDLFSIKKLETKSKPVSSRCQHCGSALEFDLIEDVQYINCTNCNYVDIVEVNLKKSA